MLSIQPPEGPLHCLCYRPLLLSYNLLISQWAAPPPSKAPKPDTWISSWTFSPSCQSHDPMPSILPSVSLDPVHSSPSSIATSYIMEATISSNLHYITSYLTGLLSIFKNANLFFLAICSKSAPHCPQSIAKFLCGLKSISWYSLSCFLYSKLAILSYLNF